MRTVVFLGISYLEWVLVALLFLAACTLYYFRRAYINLQDKFASYLKQTEDYYEGRSKIPPGKFKK